MQIENLRAASVADTVQRGLGMLPLQAVCEDFPDRKIEETGKVVPLSTACQVVTPV